MLSTIKTSFFDKLETDVALWPTPLPIYYNNVDTTLPSTTHLRPSVLPAPTDTIGVNTLGQEKGIFQVSVYVKKGVGQLAAIEIAEDLITLFPRNLELTGVRLDKYGSIAPSFFSDGWQVTPVSFEYQQVID